MDNSISIIIGLIIVIVTLVTIIRDKHKEAERYRKDWEHCRNLLTQERKDVNTKEK